MDAVDNDNRFLTASSGMAAGGLTAILLNLILPEEKKS